MIFSILKWYALTFGAWKRYRWWKALPATKKFDILLRKHYRIPILRELHREKVLSFWDTHEAFNRQQYTTRQPTEEEWRNMQVKVEAGSMLSR